jgi:hypothetical protein
MHRVKTLAHEIQNELQAGRRGIARYIRENGSDWEDGDGAHFW